MPGLACVDGDQAGISAPDDRLRRGRVASIVRARCKRAPIGCPDGVGVRTLRIGSSDDSEGFVGRLEAGIVGHSRAAESYSKNEDDGSHDTVASYFLPALGSVPARILPMFALWRTMTSSITSTPKPSITGSHTPERLICTIIVTTTPTPAIMEARET